MLGARRSGESASAFSTSILEEKLTSTDELSTELAARRRGLRLHAMAFVVVVVLLGALDWYTAEPYWIHWVAMGWGAGLATHAWLASGRAKAAHA
jgi:hypothetical protein